MSVHNIDQRLKQVSAELAQMAASVDPAQLDALAEAINQAPRVFFSGQGRSGLMIKAIAVRLMHIGLTVYVAGESNTPAIGNNDLLIAVSSSAKTQTTLMHIAAARKASAQITLISSGPAADIAADLTLYLPARKQVATDQHAGSLFEQSLLITGDAIAWRIQRLRGMSDADLDNRHANLQ